MRLTTENFFSMLKGEGITFEIHGEHIFSTNGYKDTIKQLYGLLDKQPDFEAGLIQSMNMKHTTSLKDFMTDTEGAGVKVELHELHNLTFTGGKAKSRERLAGILERNNRLKAAVILSLAAKNAKNQNFLDVIQECACNR